MTTRILPDLILPSRVDQHWSEAGIDSLSNVPSSGCRGQPVHNFLKRLVVAPWSVSRFSQYHLIEVSTVKFLQTICELVQVDHRLVKLVKLHVYGQQSLQ